MTAEALRFIETFDFDALDGPLDVPAHFVLAPKVAAPFSDALRTAVARQTTNRWFLNNLTLSAGFAASNRLVRASRIAHRFGLILPSHSQRA